MRAELQAAWADIGSGGRARGAEVLELAPDERADRLSVELHDGRGTLAAGSIPISTLWEARPFYLLLHLLLLVLISAPASTLLGCCKWGCFKGQIRRLLTEVRASSTHQEATEQGAAVFSWGSSTGRKQEAQSIGRAFFLKSPAIK